MLDHVNWYLVELERRLRGCRSAQSTTDLLLETRAHLDERIEELTNKGLDPVTAAKCALADFGDPDSVVRAYSGSLGVSSTVFRFWIGLASVAALAALALLAYALCVPRDANFGLIAFLTVVAVAAPVVPAARARRWTSIPVIALTLVAGSMSSLWIAANTTSFEWNGQNRVLFEGERVREVRARADWLAAYDREFPVVQAWRAERNGPRGDDRLKSLFGNGEFLVPVKGAWASFDTSGGLPGHGYGRRPRMSTLGPEEQRRYALIPYPTFADARTAWLTNGDDYAAWLKEKGRAVRAEANALANPRATTFGERWWWMGGPLLAACAFGSLIALLANGLAVALADAGRWRRRVRWRRALG